MRNLQDKVQEFSGSDFKSQVFCPIVLRFIQFLCKMMIRHVVDGSYAISFSWNSFLCTNGCLNLQKKLSFDLHHVRNMGLYLYRSNFRVSSQISLTPTQLHFFSSDVSWAN